MIDLLTLWECLNLLPTLLHGYVLVALPDLLARGAAVLCLGCGISISWPAFRIARDRIRTAEDD